MKEYTDIKEYNKALDFVAFSQFAGEEVVEAKRFIKPGASLFLPSKAGWELTTLSGKILECTDVQKMQIKIPSGIIKYTGPKHDQFESNQGYYH